MWYLIEENPEQPPAPRHWLGGVAHTEGRTIGRKHVHIRLKASSVSRTHAKLIVQKAPFFAHPHPHRHTTTVSIIDSSAYGTFLKYPDGHRLAKSSPSHHVRLDKNTPTQIFDGALLSFGAPAAWWRLVWHPFLAVPSHLSNSERLRLAEIVTQSGLEVSDDWAENATHLVTNHCASHSMKFLSALASRAHVVTTAWAAFVYNVVINAGQAIAGAQHSDAAVAEVATRLPDEKRFTPEFKPEDVEMYGNDVLKHVFDEANVKKRATLFQNFTISFLVERRFARWSNIIELCGGHATLANASGLAQDKGSNAKLLDSAQRTIVIGNSRQPGNPAQIVFPEGVLVKALLTADTQVFEEDGLKLDVSHAVPTSKGEGIQDEDSDSDDRVPVIQQININASVNKDPSECDEQLDDTAVAMQPTKYLRLDEGSRCETKGQDDAGVPLSGKKRTRPMSDLVESPDLINTTTHDSMIVKKQPESSIIPSSQRESRRSSRLGAHERILRTMKQCPCHKETVESAVAEALVLNGNEDAEVVPSDQPIADSECARAHEVDLIGRENMQAGDDVPESGEPDVLKEVDFVTDEHGWQQRCQSLNENKEEEDTSKRDFFVVQPMADPGRGTSHISTNRQNKEKDVRPFQGTRVTVGRLIVSSALRYVDELNTLGIESREDSHANDHRANRRNGNMEEVVHNGE